MVPAEGLNCLAGHALTPLSWQMASGSVALKTIRKCNEEFIINRASRPAGESKRCGLRVPLMLKTGALKTVAGDSLVTRWAVPSFSACALLLWSGAAAAQRRAVTQQHACASTRPRTAAGGHRQGLRGAGSRPP